jgi:hypothetical protein
VGVRGCRECHRLVMKRWRSARAGVKGSVIEAKAVVTHGKRVGIWDRVPPVSARFSKVAQAGGKMGRKVNCGRMR